VNHFKRRGSTEFIGALRENRVLLHSLVYTELVLARAGHELPGLLRRAVTSARRHS
jgi:hypothetical protein